MIPSPQRIETASFFLFPGRVGMFGLAGFSSRPLLDRMGGFGLGWPIKIYGFKNPQPRSSIVISVSTFPMCKYTHTCVYIYIFFGIQKVVRFIIHKIWQHIYVSLQFYRFLRYLYISRVHSIKPCRLASENKGLSGMAM